MSEILKHIESSANSLEEQAKQIQKSYTSNTDFISKWVDLTVGVFWGETVKSVYEWSMSRIREQAKENQVRLLEEVWKNTLRPELSQKIQDLKTRLINLQWKSLEEVSAIQMMQNTDIKQTSINTLYWLKWEIKWVAYWLKEIITGALDLAGFMVKYSRSILGINPEYKKRIDEQAGKLYDWVNKEWMTWIWDQIEKLIEQEMKRISKLPQEEQAEAIGNIAGNIISLLTAIKAGTMIVDKVWKTSRQVAIWAELIKKWGETAQRTERLIKIASLSEKAKRGKIALQGVNVFLNWVAESMIGYSLAKSLAITLDFIKSTTPSIWQKISRINENIKELESALKTQKDTEKQKNIIDTIARLREEKVKLERPRQNIQEISTNAEMSIEDRLKKASELLGGKILSPQQQKIICDIHNNISNGVYQNWYTELRKMSEALKKAWFQEDERRMLMENGILGIRFGSTKKFISPDISEYDVWRLTRMEGPEERMAYRNWISRPLDNSILASPKSDDDTLTDELLRIARRPYERARYNKQSDPIITHIETPQEQRKRLTRKRKWWTRDPEEIIETAKQNWAKLFLIAEDLMKKNPNLTWKELKELILQRALTDNLDLSSYHGRILDKCVEIFDDLKIKKKERIQSWFDEANIEIPKNTIEIEKSLNANAELNFIVWRDTVVNWMSQTNILTMMIHYHGKKINITKDLLENKNNSWDLLLRELHQMVWWVSITLDHNPLTITIHADDNNMKLYWDSFVSNLGGLFYGKDNILMIWKSATKETIDHEHQHFLNSHFMDILELVKLDKSYIRQNESLLSDNTQSRVGRVVLAEERWILRWKIWISMQDELCSYIERNWELPLSIEPYLNSKLKEMFDQKLIPPENIREIADAISEIKKYFDNTKVAREELVWIIRTSHSMEDMLARLRKNFSTLIETQNISESSILFWDPEKTRQAIINSINI
jgi:hypothetical protein